MGGDEWGGGGGLVIWSRLIVLCVKNELSVGNWDVERLRELHSWTSSSADDRDTHQPHLTPPHMKYPEISLKIPVIHSELRFRPKTLTRLETEPAF